MTHQPSDHTDSITPFLTPTKATCDNHILDSTAKRPYCAPHLTIHGKLERLTMQGASGLPADGGGEIP